MSTAGMLDCMTDRRNQPCGVCGQLRRTRTQAMAMDEYVLRQYEAF